MVGLRPFFFAVGVEFRISVAFLFGVFEALEVRNQ